MKIFGIAILFISTMFLSPVPIKQEGKMTASEVIDVIKSNVSCPWSEETVDTFKAGDPDDAVTGIACTFTATMEVLRSAQEMGCNLIITHEPTFYNHLDDKSMLSEDPIQKEKLKYIEEHGLIIFRFHDHIHRTSPDGIDVGMIRKFGWSQNLVDDETNIVELPGSTVGSITRHLKDIFKEATIRVIGDPEMSVNRVGYSPGASGFRSHLKLLQQDDIQLLIIGEANEWETVEYVRDAAQMGMQKALIILGHAVSEEAGMKYCAEWLKELIGDIPIYFLEAGDPFNENN